MAYNEKQPQFKAARYILAVNQKTNQHKYIQIFLAIRHLRG